jgi:hypothetical protein
MCRYGFDGEMRLPPGWAQVKYDNVKSEAKKILHILQEGRAANRDELSETEMRVRRVLPRV